MSAARVISISTRAKREADIRDDAVGFGMRAADTMLTKGRIERHLSRVELAAALALAYETGARAALAKEQS